MPTAVQTFRYDPSAPCVADNIVFIAIGHYGSDPAPTMPGVGWQTLAHVGDFSMWGYGLIVYWRVEPGGTTYNDMMPVGNYASFQGIEVTGLTPADVTSPAALDAQYGPGVYPAVDVSGPYGGQVMGISVSDSDGGAGGSPDVPAWAGGGSLGAGYTEDLVNDVQAWAGGGVGSGVICYIVVALAGGDPAAFWTEYENSYELI